MYINAIRSPALLLIRMVPWGDFYGHKKIP
jgi:hypothetical protein